MFTKTMKSFSSRQFASEFSSIKASARVFTLPTSDSEKVNKKCRKSIYVTITPYPNITFLDLFVTAKLFNMQDFNQFCLTAFDMQSPGPARSFVE